VDELDRWATSRAADLIARAEAEAVAELKAALLRAAAAERRAERAPAARATAAPRATAPTATPPAPRPASPAGDALWAYCIARDDAALAEGGPGVHPDGEVAWVREGGLAVLCSRVPLAEFGEEPLRRNLNELPWLERTARAHEAAIDAAFAQTPVVPLRLCTIFSDEAGARRMLRERGSAVAAALDAVAGREEWSVKLLVDRDRLAEELRTPGEEPADAGSGAAYLLLRREERRLREAVDDRAAGLAEDVHARLQERAVDARVRPAQNRELSGYEGDMVLNGAYLVERDQADGLRALVAELQERHGALGARIELGGPFPPYSFVPEDQ
jgi:Gas vesicle synthesis protein GvpL/GvpF